MTAVMNEEPAPRPVFLWIALALWAAAFAYSFWVFQATAPVGDGFTRGLNRVTGFLGWQVLAGVLAVIAFALGRALPRGRVMRRMSVLPLAFAGLLAAAVALLILWARIVA